MKTMFAVQKRDPSAQTSEGNGVATSAAAAWRPAFMQPSNGEREATAERPVAATDFTVSSNVTKEGCITFDALFVNVTSENERVNGKNITVLLLPFGLGQTLLKSFPDDVPQVVLPPTTANGVMRRVPLIEPLTEDGTGIRVLYKMLRSQNPNDPNAKKKLVTFVEVASTPSDLNNTAIVANAVPIRGGIYVAKNVTASMPAPMTCVRVYNYSLATDSDMKACYVNIGNLDARPHEALNALPKDVMLNAIFPSDKMLLPSLDLLMPFRNAIFSVSEHGRDSKDVASDRRRNLSAAGLPPLPLMHTEFAQEWSPGYDAPDPFTVPITTPIRGFPKDPLTSGVFLYALRSKTPMFTQDEKASKFSFKMNFALVSGKKRACLNEMNFWPRSFASLGVHYPTWIEAFLSVNPVPMSMLWGIDTIRTLMFEDNLPSRRPNVFPDGIITPDAHVNHFRLYDYVTRNCFPCSLGVVRSRYFLREGNPSIKPRWAEDKPVGSAVGLKDFVELPASLKLENDHASMKAFETTGIAALDSGDFEIPTEPTADIKFYFAPMSAINGDIPRKPRADPFVDDPAEDIPLAVDMTEAEGDALLQKNCPNGRYPADFRSWCTFDKGKPVPRFLFFMVRVPSAEETQRKVQLYKSTLAAMTKPFPNLQNRGLPATYDAWLKHVLTPAAAASSSATEPADMMAVEHNAPVANADTTAPVDIKPEMGKKRSLEADADTEHGNETKAARFDPFI